MGRLVRQYERIEEAMIIIEVKKLFAILLVLIVTALLIRVCWTWQLDLQSMPQTRMQEAAQEFKSLLINISPIAWFLTLLIAVLIWYQPTGRDWDDVS